MSLGISYVPDYHFDRFISSKNCFLKSQVLTLPAPARSQQLSTLPASTETRRAPTERTWAELWQLGSVWSCCFWRCSYPRRFIQIKQLLYQLQVTPPTIPPLRRVQRIPPPKQLALLCSPQPASAWSYSPSYISTVKRLRPRNICTSPSSKPNPNGV